MQKHVLLLILLFLTGCMTFNSHRRQEPRLVVLQSIDEFKLFECVDFYQRPGPKVSELNLTRIPMLHNADCRKNPNADRWSGEWLDVSFDRIQFAIRKKLKLSERYDGYLIADYEPYLGVWNDQVIASYLEVINSMRATCPKAKIGVFGIPNVKYFPKKDGVAQKLTIDMIRPVLMKCDFLAPQFYTGRTNWTETDERNARNSMAEIQVLKKEIIPVIHGRTVGVNKGNWIEIESLIARVEFLVISGAAGVIYWDYAKANIPNMDDLQARQLSSLKEIKRN